MTLNEQIAEFVRDRFGAVDVRSVRLTGTADGLVRAEADLGAQPYDDAFGAILRAADLDPDEHDLVSVTVRADPAGMTVEAVERVEQRITDGNIPQDPQDPQTRTVLRAVSFDRERAAA